MGKRGREHRERVAAGLEPPRSAVGKVSDAVADKADDLKDMARSQMGSAVTAGIIKLVQTDVRKGRVKDTEAYVQKCLGDLFKNKKAFNMVASTGIGREDIEATIRATLAEAR